MLIKISVGILSVTNDKIFFYDAHTFLFHFQNSFFHVNTYLFDDFGNDPNGPGVCHFGWAPGTECLPSLADVFGRTN